MPATGIHHNRNGIITWAIQLDDGRHAYIAAYVPRDIVDTKSMTYRLPRAVVAVENPTQVAGHHDLVIPMPTLYLRSLGDGCVYSKVAANSRIARAYGTPDVWRAPELTGYYNLYNELLAHVCPCHLPPMTVYFINDYRYPSEQSPLVSAEHFRINLAALSLRTSGHWPFAVDIAVGCSVRELYRIDNMITKHIARSMPVASQPPADFEYFPVHLHHQVPEMRYTAERVVSVPQSTIVTYDTEWPPLTSARQEAKQDAEQPALPAPQATPVHPLEQPRLPYVCIPTHVYHYLVGFHAQFHGYARAIPQPMMHYALPEPVQPNS